MRNLKITLAVAAGVLALASGGVTQAASTSTAGIRPNNATIVVGSSGGTVITGGKVLAGQCLGTLGASSLTIATGAISAIPATAAKPAIPILAKFGFGGIKVTTVNGSTILGTELGGTSAITVTVGVTTTYTEAGQSVTLADVHPGSDVAVCGTPGDGNTIQATSVTILLPQVQGVVTAVNGATFTVTGVDGSSHLVSTNASTVVKQLDATAAVSNLAIGTAVLATGNYQSDHSLLALSIDIQLPSVVGTVTAVDGNSITVDSSEIGGQLTTIMTSTQTVYNAKGETAAATTSNSVKVGSYVIATGTESTDGTTLSALRIAVLPDGVPASAQSITITSSGS